MNDQLKSNPIIWTDSLSKQFNGDYAVRDVSFEVPRGMIFGFIGPSGSGKTTTIRMLTGYYKPTEGQIKVFDQSPADFGKRARERFGYLPQLFVLYPDLTVWENVNFTASIYGLPLRRNKILNEKLDFVELGEHKGKLARDISGGMQRRLSLAATLLHDPELIFLDEPTAGVDPVLRRKFWDHFQALKEQGRTLFITTQYVSEAAYCDMVAVINAGRLIRVDSPHGLRYNAFGGDIVELRTVERLTYEHLTKLQDLSYVRREIERVEKNIVRLTVNEASTDIQALLNWCAEQGLEVDTIEEYLPPFDDVFVELVRKDNGGNTDA